MYSSTFIFAEGEYDQEFYRLDGLIAEAAKKIPGYLGEETWKNQETGLISNVYYWNSLEAMQTLIGHPQHREAKQSSGKWLHGYQVVVSQILRSYGDGKIHHPLSAFSESN